MNMKRYISSEQYEQAVKDCSAAGQNPFLYIDYSDLRKGKQNWEYFLKTPERADEQAPNTIDELKSMITGLQRTLSAIEVALARDEDVGGAMQLITRNRDFECKNADERIGFWLSAALDDPNVCKEMKDDIEAWFKVRLG